MRSLTSAMHFIPLASLSSCQPHFHCWAATCAPGCRREQGTEQGTSRGWALSLLPLPPVPCSHSFWGFFLRAEVLHCNVVTLGRSFLVHVCILRNFVYAEVIKISSFIFLSKSTKVLFTLKVFMHMDSIFVCCISERESILLFHVTSCLTLLTSPFHPLLCPQPLRVLSGNQSSCHYDGHQNGFGLSSLPFVCLSTAFQISRCLDYNSIKPYYLMGQDPWLASLVGVSWYIWPFAFRYKF